MYAERLINTALNSNCPLAPCVLEGFFLYGVYMLTKLEIINHLLNVIGENPVTSATSPHPSVLSAVVMIDGVSKELQSRGWWFNMDYDLRLLPDQAGNIIIPSTALAINVINPSSKLVRRGTKLYDPKKHTFIIDAPVDIDLITLLDIEDLPDTAAIYVKHKAAFDFYTNDDGDPTKGVKLEADAMRAWAKLLAEELRVTKLNSNNRPVGSSLRGRFVQAGSSYNPKYPGGR